jgi:hypothetical protein
LLSHASAALTMTRMMRHESNTVNLFRATGA